MTLEFPKQTSDEPIDNEAHAAKRFVGEDYGDAKQDDPGLEEADESIVSSRNLNMLRAQKEAREVQAAQEDPALMNGLIEKFEPLVKKATREYFLAGGDNDDLWQVGRIALYEAILGYDSTKGTFRNFAELCIRRRIIDAITAAKRGKHSPLNSYRSFSDTVAGTEDSGVPVLFGDTLPGPRTLEPPVVASSSEEMDALVSALGAGMSELEANVLRMFLNGSSYDEISEQLGVDEKSVDNALQRVKSKVKNIQKRREVKDVDLAA